MKTGDPMQTNDLFTRALALTAPWEVVGLDFDAERKRLDIRVDFAPGSTFPCPVCSEPCKVHDAKPQQYRHLNFFEHLAFLHARQPRTNCPKDGVKTVDVPWARPEGEFTLLFEAMVVEMGRNGLTPSAIGRMVGEHDTRIWRILEHYVGEARARDSHAGVTRVGVDETSRQKGHVYVTLFADMVAARVLTVAEGKDHGTVACFRGDFVAHGGDPAKVSDFSLDMSAAFIKGLRENFPAANLTFDPFHVIQLMNEAVDEVRRAEQKNRPELKKTRYSWLRNEKNMLADERERFQALKDSTLATARAWRIKTQLQSLYDQEPAKAEGFFKRWYFWATHSRLKPVIRVAKTLHAHRAGVLRWFESHVNNGLLEGFNSLVQAAKARSRGFRSVNKMATIIYLLLSKLDFRLPLAIPSAIHAR
jgi:transposase